MRCRLACSPGKMAAVRRAAAQRPCCRCPFAFRAGLFGYRFYFGTRVGDKCLCVVVKVLGEDRFILTAYLTDRI